VLALARRQLQFARAEALGREDHDAVAIQIIAIGDLPAQFDGVRVQYTRAQRKGLLNRQQLRFIDGGTGGWGKRSGQGQNKQHQAGQQQTSNHAESFGMQSFVECPAGERRGWCRFDQWNMTKFRQIPLAAIPCDALRRGWPLLPLHQQLSIVDCRL